MISATIRHTVVLAALLLATGFSYYAFVTGFNQASSFFVAIILSAGLKTGLLLWFFMELRSQSWGLKVYSLIWVAACVSVISVLH